MARSVAVGFFDGVHRGHQQVLRHANAVVTFRNHPLTVLAPERAPRLIMSVDARLAAIRACGISNVTALDFTPALAALSPEAFATRHLAQDEDNITVFCGSNWRFGAQGQGDAAWLRQHGYTVKICDYAVQDGEPISSTRIRRALEAGEMENACAMLGRLFTREGRILHGKGLGRELGYPTVNLALVPTATVNTQRELDLPHGVYDVEIAGARALANYGLAPTLGERAWKTPILEAHFIRAVPPPWQAGDIQVIAFRRFMRPERSFASLQELKRQIALDLASIR